MGFTAQLFQSAFYVRDDKRRLVTFSNEQRTNKCESMKHEQGAVGDLITNSS